VEDRAMRPAQRAARSEIRLAISPVSHERGTPSRAGRLHRHQLAVAEEDGNLLVALGKDDAGQAAGAAAMVESWRAGRTVCHDTSRTIADGINVRVPVPQALDDMRGRIDEAFLVSEEAIVEAMRLVHTHAGIVAEPSAVVGVAALLERPGQFREQCVGTIVCGGNLSASQMREWL
ncbi:MAG: pyridoxal-phosphate dependent enzyme, partial [Gammaproteobacteria bacterium]|nr:pyridoxal-phosphate dependent enzyme [Gammaproteobacteria bacterium]